MTRRRLAFLLAAGLLAAPLAAGAQQAGKTAVIGFLVPANPPPGWIEALRVGLRDLGYVEGQNLKIEHRFAEGEAGHFPGLFAELVRLKVDVIVTWTTPAALAAKQATSTIPIVAYTGNPVATGLVATLARPGGNVTGIAILTEEVDRKSLELLKEAVPAASQIAILTNPTNPVWPPTLREVQKAARTPWCTSVGD
jgi:putative tryptophan/tyrosine transport system substrate-binding protein